MSPLTAATSPDVVMDGHASHVFKGEDIKTQLVSILASSFSSTPTKKINSAVERVIAELEADERMKGALLL